MSATAPKSGDTNRLVDALPRSIKFYEQGDIRLLPDADDAPADLADLADCDGVAFNFQNDLTGLLLVLFEKGLDVSMYTEVGNLLASRMATELSREQQLDVMISPPRMLSDSQLSTILFAGHPMVQRTYHHFAGGLIIPVHALIIPIPSEGVGHA